MGNGSSSSSSEATTLGDARECWGREGLLGNPNPNPNPANRTEPLLLGSLFALLGHTVPFYPSYEHPRKLYVNNVITHDRQCVNVYVCVQAHELSIQELRVTEMCRVRDVYEIGMTEKMKKNSSLLYCTSDLL